jgi:hypothetical protein
MSDYDLQSMRYWQKRLASMEASLFLISVTECLVTLRVVMRDRIAKPKLPLIGGDE